MKPRENANLPLNFFSFKPLSGAFQFLDFDYDISAFCPQITHHFRFLGEESKEQFPRLHPRGSEHPDAQSVW